MTVTKVHLSSALSYDSSSYMHPALTDVAFCAARGLPPAHTHTRTTRTTRHKPLRPEPGHRQRKGQGQGFTSSDHDAAQIRHQGDTSHHVLCVVTRASLLPNSTSAAQASQAMNHVPPRCPLEQRPSLCMLMSLHQRGQTVTSQGGLRLSDVCLPAPCESRLLVGQGGEN